MTQLGRTWPNIAAFEDRAVEECLKMAEEDRKRGPMEVRSIVRPVCCEKYLTSDYWESRAEPGLRWRLVEIPLEPTEQNSVHHLHFSQCSLLDKAKTTGLFHFKPLHMR